MMMCLKFFRLVPLLLLMLFSSHLVFAACADEGVVTFPLGAATPSETCGECHGAIYREYVFGVGSDTHSSHPPLKAPVASMPAAVSSSPTGHASTGSPTAGIAEDKIAYCNGCHFPKSFGIEGMETAGKKHAEAGNAMHGGLTCAGCHVTSEGKVRTVHKVKSPHLTVVEPELQSSTLCAHCHGYYATGERVVGKQMQTFLEWQEDFYQPGLGKQQCQDCHMPRTLRPTSDFDKPERASARHLWTGANSRQRHLGSLSLTIVREKQGAQDLSFHVTNIGAGHSVPTGMSCRAVYLRVEVLDQKGSRLAGNEWMFAPFQGDRMDDRKFLEEDRKLGKDGEAAAKGDAQGPHEFSIRAGEDRILHWVPKLAPGEYTVKAQLSYTLDRFAEHPVTDERSILANEVLNFPVK